MENIQRVKEILFDFHIEAKKNGKMEAVGHSLQCEIYYKHQHGRLRYLGGQEFPDYKFPLSFFCFQFSAFEENITELATEISRALDGRELGTIFISDRIEDGYVDSFELQS